MRSRHCLYALFALLLWLPQLGAQQITGTVRDQRTGQPMAAVQIFIAGSGIGALSQQNGRYLLLNVPVGTQTITAQRIGYDIAGRRWMYTHTVPRARELRPRHSVVNQWDLLNAIEL